MTNDTESLELIYYPDPRLLKPAAEIPEVDDRIRARAARMIDIMHEKKGVGLAANQVGWLERLIVICPTAQQGEEIVLINPVITASSGKMRGEEGCLSIPQIYADVDRFEQVTVRALDLQGDEFEIDGEDLLSVVLQHEIDHLEGILFISRLTPVDRDRHKKRLLEMKREYQAGKDG